MRIPLFLWNSLIYNKILKPLSIIPGFERVYIIPDKELWFVPFESLVTKYTPNKPYHKLTYFIDQQTLVSYHFSIRAISYLYNQIERNDTIKEINRVAFTAGTGRTEAEESDINSNLKKWMKKVSSVIDKKGGMTTKSLYDEFSDVNSFFAFIKAFDAVVFAAHGSFEEHEQPKLRLNSSQTLSRRDIKKVGQLNWELLILYTCFSGDGELRNGEGLMTLCRAFFERHVQNIVYSLYMVNSKYNKKVMNLFFKEIVEPKSSNVSFARALSAAKRKIAHAKGAVPSDWSGLLFIGDQNRSLFN